MERRCFVGSCLWPLLQEALALADVPAHTSLRGEASVADERLVDAHLGL